MSQREAEETIGTGRFLFCVDMALGFRKNFEILRNEIKLGNIYFIKFQDS